MVAEAEETARENIDGELPAPEAVPDEAPAERFPIRALLRPPMVGRLGLFIGIWFVYYVGNYGWLTLAPTLFTDKGYSLAASTTYLIVSGIGFLVGAYATTHFSDRLERKYTIAVFAVVLGISLLVIGFFVSPTIIIIFGFIASTTIGLLVPMLYTYTAEHFSTNARATGVALTDGLGHVGGALAPLIVLGANSAWGFSAAFLVMGISGFVAAALILFGITATGRSLETVTASGRGGSGPRGLGHVRANGPAERSGGGGGSARSQAHGLGQQLVGTPARLVVVGDRDHDHLVGAVVAGQRLQPGADLLGRADDRPAAGNAPLAGRLCPRARGTPSPSRAAARRSAGRGAAA